MRSFFKNIFSTIVGMFTSLILFSLLVLGLIAVFSSNDEIKIKKNSILELNLSEVKVVERVSNNPIKELVLNSDVKKTIALLDVLNSIERAKKDKNIKAIYINTSSVNAGISQIEEIRNKLLEFKKTKKQIIAYSENYSQSAYYLASVADKVYLNPAGMMELKGLSITQMFYKGLLEKLDIDVQIIRHGEFKSAVEPFMLEKMSEENREQMSLLLNSVSNTILESIGKERNININDIKEHINNISLENPNKCVELNYIDGLLYEDQVKNKLKSISKAKTLNIVSLVDYNKTKEKEKEKSKKQIAIIYANGSISSGEGDENNIGSITTAKAIEKARKDKNIKAIVLRVNSGGGSALASDVIWRETYLTKKPLVVSMGDYAASGGYYIACAADKIIANTTTLTGSIGVFGMIPNMQEFYKNKLGITLDTVNTHKHADIGINRPLTRFEKEKIQKMVHNTYETFISKVSKGRGMNKQSVDKIGQGRVWSGYDAKNIGLIDKHGGIEKAIKIAANLAKIKSYDIISLPKEKESLLVDIAKSLNANTDIATLVLEKTGLQSDLINPINEVLKADKIQARIPYVIKLK